MVFRFRPAAPRDRAAVFAFCAHTWPDGDYIPHVWDDWLADRTGLLVVGVDATDTPVAVGKLTVVAPGEGWLEGLRVAPALRRQGWGRALTAHLTARAWARGLHVVRWLTAARNTPMHRVAAALGYTRRGEVVPLRAPADAAAPPLRRAAPAEAAALWETVAARVPSAPLRWRGWAAATATPAWLAAAVAAGHALVAHPDGGLVVVAPRDGGEEADVALLVGAPTTYPALLAGARAAAAGLGAARVLALLAPEAAAAARGAGWLALTEQPMALYERARPAA